ncbi:immunity protein YezG family protein [Bacillus sp. RAR_GA_16]|uniref:immunity protein YezG family protein n=1 Tax=Bacillus sp. RAR_GA_16 TaxID=2876774 RepID=UPI001CC94087|nr:immunity protein YezG family protein [Bacillus sp. RAR_GA_16]MCA0174646.1 antitoxin YezG family protein [Bacillus sp. RAR_GA_16]
MEDEMNSLYRKLAETVNDMIPEEWMECYLYAQISETGGGTYFFYNTNEQDYKYSLEIPFNEIDEDEFEAMEDLLYKFSKELREVFSENGQEPWYSFTMSLKRKGPFHIHFDYTDWFNTEYSFSDQMMIWKNKYLGEQSVDDSAKKIIKKYHIDFPQDPI